MQRHLLLCLAATAALAACQREQATTPPAAPTTTPAPQAASSHDFKPAIDAGDFVEHVKVLASDDFEGRGPGTPGEDKSVEYIKAQMQRIGLKPGNDGQWFQTVPMVETTAAPDTSFTLTVDGKPRTLKMGDDMVIGTTTGKPEINIKDSPLVFVGYGVDAPGVSWMISAAAAPLRAASSNLYVQRP
jgi:hypothetical protein